MGVAAYARGSKAIADDIHRDFMDRGGRSRMVRECLERAERAIDPLDAFSRKAQDLFVDAGYPETAKGFLKSQIYAEIQRKQHTKRYKNLRLECVNAHNQWVNADRQQSVLFLQASRRKARAWLALLDYLRGSIVLKFEVPRHI
tara:strand:- start:990 stop:1421 length:432 start_codon:yes stop_codon:yes gene_type:complete